MIHTHTHCGRLSCKRANALGRVGGIRYTVLSIPHCILSNKSALFQLAHSEIIIIIIAQRLVCGLIAPEISTVCLIRYGECICPWKPLVHMGAQGWETLGK